MNAVARKFYPEVRIKKLFQESRGIRAEDALAQAQKHLDAIKDTCLAGVDVKIEQVLECASRAQPELERCYTLSNEIFAEAGAFGLAELSGVAYSLCGLLSVADRSRLPLAAVTVHVDSMRALRVPAVADNAALRAAVLTELRALTQRFAKE